MKGKKILDAIIFFLIILYLLLFLYDFQAYGSEKSEEMNLIAGESTAYCYGSRNASGEMTRAGTCAGKPEWIGKGCILYENHDGIPGDVIGIYEIKDTGSDERIQGGTCIDVYLPDKEKCLEWGRKKVFIQIVEAEG